MYYTAMYRPHCCNTISRTLAAVFQEKGPQGVGCAIAYGFEARLHRPGLLHSDTKAKSQLKVFSRPQETAAAMPVLVGPEAQTVKTCCCFKSGRSVAAMMAIYIVSRRVYTP